MSNVYESEELVAQYSEFHYGAEYFEIRNFPLVCVELAIDLTQGAERRSALDVGCALGRSTFELGMHYKRVDGIDSSNSFISAAEQLRSEGSLRWDVIEEGDFRIPGTVTLEELTLEEARNKVSFKVDDACTFTPTKGRYDLIVAFNLLCRLPDPIAFLETIPGRLKAGGCFVLSTPSTWSEEITPRDKWIGGFERDDQYWTTLDGLQHLLWGKLKMIADPIDIPFVIRETRRKYQHSFAQLTVWQLVEPE